MLDPFQLVVNIYMYYEATRPQVDYSPSKKGIHSTVSGNFVDILNRTFAENGGRNVIQPILVNCTKSHAILALVALYIFIRLDILTNSVKA